MDIKIAVEQKKRKRNSKIASWFYQELSPVRVQMYRGDTGTSGIRLA